VPKEEVRCALDYVADRLTDKLTQSLLNTQQTSRLPAYIQPPLSGVCFQRHVGTGSAASGDPPIVVGPGGIPFLVADLIVPNMYKGVIKYWGINVLQGAVAAADLRWRIVVNGRRVVPFDPEFGAVVAGSGGDWAGPPFTLANPNRDLCILLNGDDNVQLQALNFGINPLDVQAMFGGWVFQPTVFETGKVVRAWMTDQH
jgi:hypothetical protein